MDPQPPALAEPSTSATTTPTTATYAPNAPLEFVDADTHHHHHHQQTHHGHHGRGLDPAYDSSTILEEHLREFWESQIKAAEEDVPDFKHPTLPLARIKKVMKSDPEVKMIGADAPILFAKACEIFIAEVTSRAWLVASAHKRRTLSRADIAKALAKSDQFDFLIDIVPREVANEKGRTGVRAGGGGSISGVVHDQSGGEEVVTGGEEQGEDAEGELAEDGLTDQEHELAGGGDASGGLENVNR
ncbi:hypothetical protein FRB99_002871 [Tulasnella sp. 403]|nr:hypothetical protein FRB99_002871 [Tulasnella sp. 403]